MAEFPNIESSNIEYKEKLNDNVFKTLSAFANTDGGTVFIGVRDDKSIKGYDCSNNNVTRVTEQVIHKLGVHPEVETQEADRQNILKISVKKSTQPISFNGRYYKRVGNTTREMQGEELRSFFIRDTNWDSLTGNYSLDEIDQVTFEKFINRAVGTGRLNMQFATESVENILTRLKLIVDGKITNAAIILFGKDPQKYFINAVVRVGRFKDETLIIGDRFIDGNLFKQAQEAEEAIKGFINVRYEIKGKLERDTIWDYPLEAIREALLNALIHRDYFKPEVQTQIKVFDDYLWYFNIGGLKEGITLEQLKQVHSSIARNPLILHIFYLAGLVEEYGSGIQRMMNAFNSAGLPEPEFSERMGGFVTCFRKEVKPEKNYKELGLNERQIKAIQYLKEKGEITNTEYQKLNDVARATVKRDIEELCQKGIVKRLGEGRNVHYKLIGSNGS